MAKIMEKFLTLLTILSAAKNLVANDICVNSACLTTAADIANRLDLMVDPCDDFFKFVCGNSLEAVTNPLKELEKQIKGHVSEILQESIDEDDYYPVQLEKKLFQGCMNQTALEEESLDTFKETLNELNGWPVAVGYFWKGRLFDWAQTVFELRRRGYYYAMLLDVDVDKDPFNVTESIITIRHPSVPDIKEEHKEQYLKFMIDVTIEFGAERNRAEIEMEKVLDFMERLKKIGKKNAVQNSADIEKLTVEEFQQENGQINWLEFINNILNPIEGISEDDYVIVPKKEFVTAFFDLMSKTPKRVQANYMIWRVLAKIIPLLSKNLKQYQKQYECFSETPKPKIKDRLEFCKHLVRKSIVPLPSLITYTRRYLPEEKREQVEKLFGNIKAEFLALLPKASWIDQETKGRVLEYLDQLEGIVGIERDYFNDAEFDNLYSTYDPVDEDNYLTMLLNIRKQRQDIHYSMIHGNTSSIFELGTLLLVTLTDPSYEPQLNTIFMPVGFLENAFQLYQPMYVNYARAGFSIAAMITKLFSLQGFENNRFGDKSGIWTTETIHAYEKIRKCIITDEQEFFTDKYNITQRVEEIIDDIAGIKVSYNAYKTWMERNGLEQQLPGIQFSPKQLFWILAMSHKCFELSENKWYDKNHMNLLNIFETTAAMRYNTDFAKDFKCSKNSQMNPIKKCEIF